MAAAAATADPPGYFVGRPLHYQEQQPQTTEPQPQHAETAAPASAVDDQNAVNAQVPGYYKGRVQPRRSDDPEHNNTSSNAGAADQQIREPSFFAKWFGCFSSTS